MFKKYFVIFIIFIVIISGCNKPESKETKSKVICIVDYCTDAPTEYYNSNLSNLLKTFGLTENKDFILKSYSAQNDMATLTTIIENAKKEKVDILVTFQSQPLYASIRRAPELKKVFSIISNPFIVGAASSDSKHIKNLTGFYYTPDYDKLIEIAIECSPAIKRIGTVFFAGDDESKRLLDKFKEAAMKKGIQVVAKPYSSQTEIVLAVEALSSEKTDALLINPNLYQDLVSPALSKAAKKMKIPIITTLLDKVDKGAATIGYGVNQKEAARKFAEILARVIKGENPDSIPFVNGKILPYNLKINRAKALEAGMKLPETILKKADKIYE
ncbi:MAG: hypothetical protein QG635_1338 [Bacteroidota bacterium]|nr:hypothetical protein [Bacteroidota bacterium]